MQFTDRQITTIYAALIAWEHQLSGGEKWIASIYDFGEESPLCKQEIRALREQLIQSSQVAHQCELPAMWKSSVPTYVGTLHGLREDSSNSPDFADPYVPVLVHEAGGIRVLLGAHDLNDNSKPDIQIERRPQGWAVFINPDAGDTVAHIYILDEGTTYLVAERYVDPELVIVDDIPAAIDEP